jgi:competence protein ComEC
LDAQDAGVLSAMLLGEKTGLAKELRSLYAQSGIAHILAISGLHISLIGAMTVRLLRRIGAARTISMLVCFIFLGSYCVMTGIDDKGCGHVYDRLKRRKGTAYL